MANIKDVALASGVSPTTVSFVLNNSGAVGARTRERVLKAARQLNYHPSAIARGFLHKRMNTIGVVAVGSSPAPLSMPYFAAVVNGIAAAAAAVHQNVTLFTEGQWTDAPSSLPLFADGRCDGFLLVGPHTQTDILQALTERSLPFVLVNERTDDPCVSEVDVDDVASAEVMTGHLIAQGHRRIALISHRDDPGGYVVRRRAGYRAGLAAAGIGHEARLDRSMNVYQSSLVDDLAALMSGPPSERPTALLCADDMMAITVMRDLRALGLSIPEDVSVAGFDDVWMAQFCHPPLTTMRQPFERTGARALELLLAQIDSGGPMGDKVLLPTELIVRHSVTPLPERTIP